MEDFDIWEFLWFVLVIFVLSGGLSVFFRILEKGLGT